MKAGVEAPRRGFFVVGYVLGGLIALLAVAVFGLSVYQFEFWDSYFFRSTKDVGAGCQVAVRRADQGVPVSSFSAMNLRPIAIPHDRELLGKIAQGKAEAPVLTAYYNCRIPVRDFGGESGIVTLNTGWIVGDQVDVKINGSQRASFNELGKLAVPLTLDDLAKEAIQLEVRATARVVAGLGFIGLTPMMVAKGTSINARVVAVDFALSNQKVLYTLLPLLTLALTMIFGWLIGIRTRMMTVTFFYLLCAALRNVLMMFADFWPWEFATTFTLSDICFHGSLLAFALFAAEMLGLLREQILVTMGAIGGAVALGVALTIVGEPTYETFTKCTHVIKVVETAAMLFVIYRGSRATFALARVTSAEVAVKRTRHVAVYLVAFVLFAIWFDFVMISVLQAPFRLSPQVEKLLPLVVGGILFYTLYLIEQMLRDERERRAKMETELTIAAKLQGVLVPKELEGTAHEFRYEIASKPHGILGGDWVKVYSGKRGALFVLGDVVGKGPSAALTHSGIAASWASQIKLWERGAVTAAELMTAINLTMYDLYQGTMNTTFAFAEVGDKGRVSLAAGGNYWLHLSTAKPVALTSPGRSLLGLKAEFTVEMREVELKPGDWLICFTDGVLEGNRPVSRFLRAAQSEFESLTGPRIRDLLAEAGRDQVHPDDASTLILRYVGRESGDSRAA